jgi:RNA polymerase sigma-70 factor (ECF subfamily)
VTAIGYCLLNDIRGSLPLEAPGLSRLILRISRVTELESPLPENLLARVAAGQPGAVEECLDQYGGLVWSLARRYFARHTDAEDAVQEAFLSLWENAHRFNASVASEGTFVAMICRRRIIDNMRRSSRIESQAAVGSDPDVTSAVDEVAAREQSTIDHDGIQLQGFEIAEEANRIRNHMKQLREEEQRVLNLAVCEGMSQTRVAEITGWPLGTVKSHARRGMKRLRDLLSIDSSFTTTITKEAVR